jgi:hypothetical protein
MIMHEAFVVTDSPRQGASEAMAATPPVSIAWRLMRPLYERWKSDRKRITDDLRTLKKAMIPVADEEHRLRREIRAANDTKPCADRDACNSRERMADRLKAALNQAGIVSLSPMGERYEGSLMEFLENIAQEPRPELDHPVVLEVVQPAVVYRDELLRAGKAVIGTPPAVQESTPSEEVDCGQRKQEGNDCLSSEEFDMMALLKTIEQEMDNECDSH